MSHDPVFDCQSCGACCCNPLENRAAGYFEYVQVHERDALSEPEHSDLRARLTFTNDKGEVHLLLTPHEQRCVALKGSLGRNVRCEIYDLRPTGCRRLEAGSERCRQYRLERGVDQPRRHQRRPDR